MNLSRKHKKALARQHAWLLFGSYYTGLIGFRFDDTKEYVWDHFQRYGKRYKNEFEVK